MTSNNQQYHSGSDSHQLKCWESLRPKPEYFTQLDKIIQDLQSIDRREAVVARNLEDISANFSAVGQLKQLKNMSAVSHLGQIHRRQFNYDQSFY
jgi:hypothetical protein